MKRNGRTKWMLFAVAALAAAAVLAACSRNNQARETQDKINKLREQVKEKQRGKQQGEQTLTAGGTFVGVCFSGPGSIYYLGARESMIGEAGKKGLEIEVEQAGRDPERMKSIVADWVRRGPRALIIEPIDAISAAKVVEMAGGAPVIILGSAADIRGAAASITPDFEASGKIAAEKLFSLLKEEPGIIIIEDGSDPSTRLLMEAFNNAAKQYSKVITTRFDCAGQRSTAKSQVAVSLKQDLVDGVFSASDECALGAVDAFVEAGAKNAVVVGFGNTPKAREAIGAGGPLAVTIDPGLARIGAQAIDAAAELAAGRTISTVNIVPAAVTKETIKPGP